MNRNNQYNDGYGNYNYNNGYNQNTGYNQSYNDRYGQYGVQTTDGSTTFAKFMAKTYLWMFFGLAITFGLALYMTLNSENVLVFLLEHFPLYMGATVVSLIMVIVLGFVITKVPPTIAKIIFIAYSADMGIILTPMLLMYELSSVIYTFAATSVLFLILAIIGLTTKRDMSKLGSFLCVALVVSLIYSLISFFFIHSAINNLIINVVVMLIFVGFTMYDNYRIKKNFASYQHNPIALEKLTILSALNIYLDYINLFIRILAIFGKKR